MSTACPSSDSPVTTGLDIVAAARSWLGTRFLHQGRLKRSGSTAGGVDCLGLLVGVAAELRLCDSAGKTLTGFDRVDYGHNPERYTLQSALETLLTPIPCDAIQPGDVALMTLERSPQHVGIISDHPDGLGLIHAYASARKVVEHRLDESWRRRIIAAYRFAARPHNAA